MPRPQLPPINYGPALIEPFQIRLLQSQMLTIGRGWNTREVRSSFWRAYINSRSGASLALADGQRWPLTPRRVHLVPAWCQFDCHCCRHVEHLFLHFDWFGVSATRLSETFDRPVTLAADPTFERLADQLGERLVLAAEGRAGLEVYPLAKALAYLAVSSLLTQTSSDRVARLFGPAASGGVVLAALDAIEQNPGARLSNTELAALCHLSVDHFVRRFREHVGQTPARYAEERRIALAAEKLVYTDDTIEQIAESLSYPDRFSFTRAFTRRMGLPPATYRRQPMV